MSFSSLISHKSGEVLIFRTFFGKILNFGLYFTEIVCFELRHDDHDVTVTPYLECRYLFWYVWKEETPSYTMVPIKYVWGFIFKCRGQCWSESGLESGLGLWSYGLGLGLGLHLCGLGLKRCGLGLWSYGLGLGLGLQPGGLGLTVSPGESGEKCTRQI